MHADRRLVRSGTAVALLLGVLFVVPPVGAGTSFGAPFAPNGTRAPLAPGPLGGTPPAGASTAAVPAPYYDWGLAYIIYGPGDDATHFMGEGAAMVVDDALGNITTFGGQGSGGLTNWTVNYNVTTGEFFITTPDPSPTARTNASFASVPGRDFAVLFGGLTGLASQRVSNETWVYYFANATWRNVTQGTAPPARESAAFAVNASGGAALLEGGWAPAYRSNNSTATILWNDTWVLNLTTFRWSFVPTAVAPAPAYGAGLLWQNRTDRYELFGGCGVRCSGDLWSFEGTPGHWVRTAGSGTPSPRAGAAWVWDPNDDRAVLFGGFDRANGGARALGDGYLYDPVAGAWSSLGAGGGPGPRYDAPNAWAQFPGCIGLNLLGGDISLIAPPTNASVLEPLGAPQPNCFPDLLSGGGGPPPPPCSSTPVPLSLFVYDNYTERPIGGASVNLDGGCVHRTVQTNAAGFANVTIPTPVKINITASANGYRSNELASMLFRPNTTNYVALGLGPLPTLRVRTYSLDGGGNVRPLGGVTLDQGSTLRLGRSDGLGFFNATALNVPGGRFTLVGSAANYSTATTPVVVPYSGPVFANLTLLAAGDLDLRIVDWTIGVPVPNETVTLSGTDPGGLPPELLVPQPSGWLNLTPLDAGNYTVASAAPGYLTNHTRVFHPWLNITQLVIPLVPETGATIRVVVRDAVSHAPIARAIVQLGDRPSLTTTAVGSALFTDVRPPGYYRVLVEAPGYHLNTSYVHLDYYQVIAPYPVFLTPLPSCPAAGCGPIGTTNGTAFGYLPTDVTALGLLTATPIALVAAGLAFLLVQRGAPARRRTRPEPERRAGDEGR